MASLIKSLNPVGWGGRPGALWQPARSRTPDRGGPAGSDTATNALRGKRPKAPSL